MKKALIKFNNARLAILCSQCRVILKTGKDFTEEEAKFSRGEGHLPPQYCRKCLCKKAHTLVYNYKTKYEHGFTKEEQEELLKEFPEISMEKYNEAMFGNTCMMIDGKIITYHCDVEHALYCGIENRGMTQAEWD